MKITKAKLKQIIKEELSALEEVNGGYSPVSHHATGDDPAGTSQVLTDALATIKKEMTKLQGEPDVGDLGPLYQSANLLSKWLDVTYPDTGPTAQYKARMQSEIDQ